MAKKCSCGRGPVAYGGMCYDCWREKQREQAQARAQAQVKAETQAENERAQALLKKSGGSK